VRAGRQKRGAFIPLIEHALSDFSEFGVLLYVGAHVRSGLGNCFVDARQSLLDLGRCAFEPGFAKPAEFPCIWPSSASVESQCHAVPGRVDGRGHEIVNGGESSDARRRYEARN
jgi:hypothetical protein